MTRKAQPVLEGVAAEVQVFEVQRAALRVRCQASWLFFLAVMTDDGLRGVVILFSALGKENEGFRVCIFGSTAYEYANGNVKKTQYATAPGGA